MEYTINFKYYKHEQLCLCKLSVKLSIFQLLLLRPNYKVIKMCKIYIGPNCGTVDKHYILDPILMKLKSQQ